MSGLPCPYLACRSDTSCLCTEELCKGLPYCLGSPNAVPSRVVLPKLTVEDCISLLKERGFKRAWALVNVRLGSALLCVAGRAWRRPPGVDGAVEPVRQALRQRQLRVGEPASKLCTSSRKYPGDLL